MKGQGWLSYFPVTRCVSEFTQGSRDRGPDAVLSGAAGIVTSVVFWPPRQPLECGRGWCSCACRCWSSGGSSGGAGAVAACGFAEAELGSRQYQLTEVWLSTDRSCLVFFFGL